ncbi:MAG: 2-amino-4-hydroxy-6-hydroxymethyldihydropteridine diphosphokinase [Candidatus Cloacimonas sp. 4484_209]|nr:MAG: 2-amino-4-hydroxy-6-hydroxymethyldihydropteridine diphosphokinase [Candidatus Cloacimonas sp. 4484_209]
MPVLKLEENVSKKTVYIGLGSNLGNREENIKKALYLLSNTEGIKLVSLSRLYNTKPVGYKEQPYFVNGVAEILTSLKPISLLNQLKKIEKEMGRKKTTRWGPRIIDLDILFYDKITYSDNILTIPHPESHKRWFVLKPMNDVASTFQHPVLKKTIKSLLEELTDED